MVADSPGELGVWRNAEIEPAERLLAAHMLSCTGEPRAPQHARLYRYTGVGIFS